MKIKRLIARKIRDTRGDPTIQVELNNHFGKFKASAPNGKSRGKFEAKPWKKSLSRDISVINSFKLKEIKFEKFDDLKKLEKIFRKKIGANTMVALEYVFLKALAKEQKKQVWQLINSNAKKIPIPAGNAIGGGSHSSGKRPDFQEFLFIPKTKKFREAIKINKKSWKSCKKILKSKKTNDENAWQTDFSNEEIMKIMQNIGKKFNARVGIDIAASEFYKNKKYHYKNYKRKLTKEQQIKFMKKIKEKFYYLEDPLEENDFQGFSKIKSKGLIVGDDLTVTNLSRIKLAIKKKAINAIIIKPNQNGSLIEVEKIVEFCKKKRIVMIFSHRSGETSDNILADLCFGFQGDFIKTGILGKGRKEKLKRLMEIERGIK